MESDEITWNIVPNTVANRMIDFSLLHKLVPCRRLRRRNKAMNAAIKQYQSIKTYSQYIQMKTSVLRNMSDDSETDCNDTFTEDDYSILYKSDVSLSNYVKETLKKNKRYPYEIESETNEDDFISDVKSKKTVIKRPRSMSPINLGWRKVKRKSQKTHSLKKGINANKFTCDNDDTEEAFSVMTDNVQSNIQSKTNTPHKYFIDCVKENVDLENQVSVKDEINTATVEDVCDTASDSTEITCHATTVQKVTNNNDKLEQSDPTVNNISKEFQSDKNYCYKMLESSNIRTQKRLSFSLYNVNEICDTNCENMSVDQNCPSQVERDLNITETFMNMPSVIGNTYQLKDSGIDEDTEEEILERGKKYYKKFKNRTQTEEEEDTSNTSSIVNSKNNLIDDDDNSKSNTSKDIILLANENIDTNQVKSKQKIQTDKLQPKVTHTEVVNKKYKIMCDISVVSENIESEELSINDFCDEKPEVKEMKLIMKDSTSPITEKRYQQLRRLNLVDSDSSTSENDDRNYNVENMRDKLFKRSSEFSDILGNENNNVHPNHEISIQLHKKIQKTDFSEQTNYCLDDEDNILKQCSNTNEDSSPDTKQLLFASNKSVQHKSDLNCTISHNFDKENHTKASSEKDLKIENMMQCEKKESTSRPYNLQEFIEKENLLVETTKPSFTLRDVEEDDEVFIIDIPSKLLENQLLQSKIAFTEKTLKLGKQKYRVEYKNIDNVSCFLGTRKRKKPYKIVNIKPTARIVVREKVTKNSHAKFSDHCSNHNIDSSDEIKDEMISRKRHFQTKQNLSLKKRCLNIDE
ncbi:uncharacterized protein PF3D7_1120600-like isoform X1 [Bombus pascuorum]|uniref:uncharacterized protein PF3D7_1120600-like isoform X1 n=1 Tax=Bombus pascuorum TaxID=65598 RepID=UPI00213BA3F7|nr:uncharacterized protein PF3D7_1120600-like isoform X1 [Bombus pascuorum]XP_060824720.1 uncharacterized protein PF3D7_1120600-like isoform X1 [Bombus pascuorum]XP_060824721.1 uncharacterized protein PF3D7_1120600-like isoform X1 [Bombus pascuorum]